HAPLPGLARLPGRRLPGAARQAAGAGTARDRAGERPRLPPFRRRARLAPRPRARGRSGARRTRDPAPRLRSALGQPGAVRRPQPARTRQLRPGARLEPGAVGATGRRHPAPGIADHRDAAPRPGRHLMAGRVALILLVVGLWLMPAPPARAGDAAAGPGPESDWPRLDPAALDAQPGGFLL